MVYKNEIVNIIEKHKEALRKQQFLKGLDNSKTEKINAMQYEMGLVIQQIKGQHPELCVSFRRYNSMDMDISFEHDGIIYNIEERDGYSKPTDRIRVTQKPSLNHQQKSDAQESYYDILRKEKIIKACTKEMANKLKELKDQHIEKFAPFKVGDTICEGGIKGVITYVNFDMYGQEARFYGKWLKYKKDGTLYKDDCMLGGWVYKNAVLIKRANEEEGTTEEPRSYERLAEREDQRASAC